jgi:hypothetical protein
MITPLQQTGFVASRTWHVSDSLFDVGPIEFAGRSPSALDGAFELGDRGGVATTDLPLWRRVLSGQSFGWRLRRASNWIRWVRRRVARRLLRWFKLHPELRHAAMTGSLRRLAASAVGGRARRVGAAARPYLPLVEIAATAAIEVPEPDVLVDGVDLREQLGAASPELNVRAAADGLLRVTEPGGNFVDLLAPVDLGHWNPSMFQWSPSSETSISLQNVLDSGASPGRRLAAAHRARAVVCDPVPSLSSPIRARLIVELACAGVPLVGELTAADRELVGAGLANAISAAGTSDVADNLRRERHSLRVRREALAQHSPRGWWCTVGSRLGIGMRSRPTVSVLLPSNRPDDVVAAASSVAGQDGVDVELVVGLHGSHMPVDLEARIREVFPGELVVRRCDDALNLGQVMNVLTEAAAGELVSKWDDDDWYESQHLADLVRALEYSGAGLVGKAAEFVYLETLDLTVRRFAAGSERWSTTIAGGTLLLTRAELVETGWAEVPRQVDRRLIDELQARGRRIYRSHGFGYVLRRRSADMAGHTWAAGDEYFLRQAIDQRSGLDLDFAGFGVHS